MHVVDIGYAEYGSSHSGEQGTLLVRIQYVITAAREMRQQVDEQQQIEPDLEARRAGADGARELRTARTEHPCGEVRWVCANPIGQNVNLVAARDELASTMIRAQGRSPGSVERLRHDLQDSHQPTSQ